MEKNSIKKSFGKKLKKRLKQKVYKWHKVLAFITMVPMLFWCLSGIMHPLMAHFFKPTIANEVLVKSKIDSAKIDVGLQEALLQNKLEEIKNFRLVSFDDNQYYQIKTKSDSIVYLNTSDGKMLENGDDKYALWLSRYFLDDAKSGIEKQEVITQFNSEYKYVNRYLPVHKICFDRDDEMQVYVETTTDKLATFNPKSRQWFIWFFDTFHNWSFIDAISNNGVRIVLMLLLLTVIGLSAISGMVIYGLFWKQFKKVRVENQHSKWRKYHRQTGLALALFTVLFAFSGGYHATKKWNPIAFEKMIYEPVFKAADLDSKEIKQLVSLPNFDNVSLIRFNEVLYYRCELVNEEEKTVKYFNAVTGKEEPSIDVDYAAFLADYFNTKIAKTKGSCCSMAEFSGVALKKQKVKEIERITDFKNKEYGFVNKRLPVIKVAYDTPENKTLFIETATSRLAAYVTNSDRVEGYSFAIFHKFLFMEWAGKDIRDLTMVLAALGVVVVGVLGLLLLFKRK
ncbi:PepSY domain-containing protein [Flavobacterium sp. GCM10027622]|uniref:PepSY domain-containing protein n=1 Tax=unclassified Flavobacterium TaxID=196869 RepID=UPI00360BBA80